MFKFEKTIAIERPLREVFAYVVDPKNTSQWRDDVLEVKGPSSPLQVGDHIEEVVNFNGTQHYMVEVVELAPYHRVVFKVISGPSYQPLRTLTFAEDDGKTLLTVNLSVHTDGFTRLIEPISSNMFSIKWESYLFHLKRILEEKNDTHSHKHTHTPHKQN